MTGNTGTSAGKALTDERIAEICVTIQRRYYEHTVVLGSCIAECAGCTVEELLAEVTRFRAVETKLRHDCDRLEEILGWEHDARNTDQRLRNELTTRAETAERELAEVRERVAELKAEREDLIETNASLRDDLTDEQDHKAELRGELAELRERIGEATPEYGLQYGAMDPIVLRAQDEVAYYRQQRHTGLRVRDVYATAWREAAGDGR